MLNLSLSKDEFYSKGEIYYGKDFKQWIFCCSICGYRQSQQLIVDEMKSLGFHDSKRYGKITMENIGELKPSIESECLSPICDFVSYGLIPSTFGKYGGMEVDGKPIFKFAHDVSNDIIVQESGSQ